MKRTLSTLLAVAVSGALLILLPAFRQSSLVVHAKSGCSAATLKGKYATTFSGFLVDNGNQPFYGEGVVTFDGTGNLSGPLNFSENGVPTLDAPYTATYTVNSDCTGVANGTNGSDSFAFVIVEHGAQVLATDITPPDTLNVDFKRQDGQGD